MKAGVQRKHLLRREKKYKEKAEYYTTRNFKIIITLPQIRTIKSRTLRFASSVAHIGRMTNAQKILVKRFYWKKYRERFRHGWNNIKVNLKYTDVGV